MRFFGWRHPVVVAFTIVCLGVVGCGEPSKLPATTPVKGKIVFERGGTIKSLYDRDSVIEFESVDTPGLRAYAPIEEDGSFTLATSKDQEGKLGLAPGKHRGRLNLEAGLNLVAPQFLSFEKSGIMIEAPASGEVSDLVVKVWK